jgi:hypothetical protein
MTNYNIGPCDCCGGGGGPCYNSCPCYAEIIATTLTATCVITTNTCNGETGTDSDTMVTVPWPTGGASSTFLCNSAEGLAYSASCNVGVRSYSIAIYCPCNCSPKVWKYTIGEECGSQSGVLTFSSCDPILAMVNFTINCVAGSISPIDCTLAGTYTITG